MSQLPWLKFTPLIAAFIIALAEALSRKTERRWLHRFLVPLLSAIALIASCWIVWSDDKASRTVQGLTATQLNRIEGKLGDDEAKKLYFDSVGKLSQQLTATTTGNSAERFFSSEQSRRQLREDTDRLNRKVLSMHDVRIKPIADYVLAKFDSWIAEANKRGVKVTVATNDSAVVTIGAQKNTSVRNATFSSTDRVEVYLHSGAVQDGRLARSFQCEMVFISGRGTFENSDVFNVFIDEKRCRLTRPHERLHYKVYENDSDNPIADKEFVDSIEAALDEVMEFVIDESTSQR